jgi:hypothetical protein
MNINNKILQYKLCSKNYSKILQTYSSNITSIDHIAFRSLNQAQNQFNKSFIKQKEIYNFPQYNSMAEWYTGPEISRVFNSFYLGVNSDKHIPTKYKDKIYEMILLRSEYPNINYGDLYKYEDYHLVYNYNQYLAWTLLHGSTINHIALNVRNIHEFCEKLKEDGYKFNNSNNIINKSEDKCLLQASLVADEIDYKFMDGVYKVPHTYVEFVERFNGRDGFENSNASIIMKSTITELFNLSNLIYPIFLYN